MFPGGGSGSGGNSGSGVLGTTKHLASRGGTHSTLSGGIFRREWSTGSGVAISSRSVGLAPGQGHGDGLGMYDDEGGGGGGGSVMSLRDNLDYSRPISGNAVMDRMRSTTTFGTDVGGDGRSAATSPSPVPTSGGGGGGGGGVGDVNMTSAGVNSRGIVAGTLSGSKRGSGGDIVEEEDEGRMR